MAIEQMRMMNLIGPKPTMNSVLVDLLRLDACEFIHAQGEVDKNNFALSLEDEDNLDKNIELNYVKPFGTSQSLDQGRDLLQGLRDFYGFKDIDRVYTDRVDMDKDYDPIIDMMKKQRADHDQIHKSLEILEEIENNRALFDDIDANLEDLSELENFNVRFGFLTAEGRFRLKKNYSNILAVFYHTGTLDKDREIYFTIYPKEMDNEIDRVLKSLGWMDIDILGHDERISKDIILNLGVEIQELRSQSDQIESERVQYVHDHQEDMKEALAYIYLKDKIEELKTMMLQSDHYYFLSAWVGLSDIEAIKALEGKYKGLSIDFIDPKKNSNPPTKLKNWKFFKPFEFLINMYGTPNYYEFDPTVIFGITYMVLFGAMFGDIGQGAVFFLAGMVLSRKLGAFGQLLKRLGLSSMVFGALYGSIFGSEEIFSGLWFKPFDQINRTLVTAICFGVLLLLISYAIGIYNQVKQDEKSQAFFSKEGVLGLVIFLNVINIGVYLLAKLVVVPIFVSVFFIVLSLVLMLFQGPIVEKLTHKKVVESKVDYYTEGIFSLVETMLSTVTGIISFIRVGAFAINHVGLFLAFQTLGKMIGSSGGNTLVLIVGNIVIIALEGLIVFIQSLRLEYYEMFSRFYKGNGRLFKADKISMKED